MDKLSINCVPSDHSKQVASNYYINFLLKKGERVHSVLDLGCGNGNSVDYFRKMIPTVNWVGIDTGKSRESRARTRKDTNFCIFDGINIPFDDDSFDLIFCNQVFEHVVGPRVLMMEINRVLRPGGYLIGAVSQLEPYHSYSVCNYTPYGFMLLVEDSGLILREVRPSIDALTLIIRRGLKRPKFFLRFWLKESPLNLLISIIGKLLRKNHKYVNEIKLLFCGQFCFLVQKPDEMSCINSEKIE